MLVSIAKKEDFVHLDGFMEGDCLRLQGSPSQKLNAVYFPLHGHT